MGVGFEQGWGVLVRLWGSLDDLGWMGICARIYVQTQVEADFRPISCIFARAWVDFE